MSDIKGTIANITRNVTKTSGDLIKTTKLSFILSTEESNLKNLHLEIGRKVHEIYQYGGSLGKYFDGKYLEIEAVERKITEIKEQIGMIKGIRECIKCGKHVERSAEFCPKCGMRLDAAAPVEPERHGGIPLAETQDLIPDAQRPPHTAAVPPEPAHTPVPPPPPLTKRCRICDSENEQSAKFCLSCGRIVD